MNYLDNNMFALSNKVLNCLWQKQVVIADNIANVETPGYKAKYVTFEDELHQKVSRAKGRQAVRAGIENTRANIHLSENESTKADGNNVNADAEQMEQAKTALQYNYMVKALNDDIARYRTVIKGQ